MSHRHYVVVYLWDCTVPCINTRYDINKTIQTWTWKGNSKSEHSNLDQKRQNWDVLSITCVMGTVAPVLECHVMSQNWRHVSGGYTTLNRALRARLGTCCAWEPTFLAYIKRRVPKSWSSGTAASLARRTHFWHTSLQLSLESLCVCQKLGSEGTADL